MCARSRCSRWGCSKTVTAILPAVLLVVFWWKRQKIDWRRDVRPLMPFFVIGLSIGIVTAWFERTLNRGWRIKFQLAPMDRADCGASDLVLPLQVGVASQSDVHLSPQWTIERGGVAAVHSIRSRCWSCLASCWLIRRWSRAPFAAMLIFCVTLAPALGFVDVYPFRYSYVADHFSYLASMAIFALFAERASDRSNVARDAGRAEMALCSSSVPRSVR